MKKGGFLFGGVFFLAGLAVFYFMVLSPVIDATKMQFWQATNGQLISAKVHNYQSRNDDGGYTTMYKVFMQYQYSIGGNNYTGKRAKIMNDNASSDSDDSYDLLTKIHNENNVNDGITIWVNPSDNRDSIYDRSLDFRFLMLMTLFSGVFMMVGWGIISYSRPEKEAILENVDPKKPWSSRTQWASPIIYSDAQKSVKHAWYFAVLASMFFGMFALAIFGQHPIATVFSILLLIPPLWLILRAKRIQKEWRYFNKVPLTLSLYPGMVGGKVKGGLTIPGNHSGMGKYSATLSCTKYWTTRSGNKTELHQSIIYSDIQKLFARPSAAGRKVDFDFSVPAGKPESSAPSSSYHKWEIAVKGDLSGINFDRNYEVPVFVTEQSTTEVEELEQHPLTRHEERLLNDRLNMDVSKEQDVMALHTPKSKDSLPIAGIGALFFIIGTLIYTIGDSFFGVVFAGMSCIFLGLGIWGYGRNCKIKVSPNNLQLDFYFFSWSFNQLILTHNEVQSIEPFSSSTTHTNGKQTSEKFSLRLITDIGKAIDLGGSFNSKKNALHLKQQVEAIFYR
ncbi:DUF3592 domain-containing protein [Colwellia sp. UCD-KL20]|uniref:DUF3592 domain-containing protein n=1 Tax=Colwellia sp. UCD-KL20 TaxID=1917165 RepID=UPI0009711283|nr:DUF3592 domain-containing protein [Colwellia sp. UCD-KL20]